MTEERVAAWVLAALGLVFLVFVVGAPRWAEQIPVAPWSPMGQERQLQEDRDWQREREAVPPDVTF